MDRLKTISQDATPAALERAIHYRLLNEPEQAESICLDILRVAPDDEEARITLLLSLTDQFESRLGESYLEAIDVVSALKGAYEQAYYTGIISERRARAHIRSNSPERGHLAYEWLQKAIEAYEEAETLRPEGNDESLLRWNTCVRAIERNSSIQPDHADATPQFLE
jgi:hypothetical protein